jgi:hypothetical protein
MDQGVAIAIALCTLVIAALVLVALASRAMGRTRLGGKSMYEKYLAVALAIGLFLWVGLALSGLDLQWLGIAIDGGLLKTPR